MSLQSALSLAAQGFHVFPLAPGGKTPAVKAFPQVATRDPVVLRRLFTDEVMDFDHGYNVGIYCGRYGDDPAHSLLVIDVDNKDGKNGSGELTRLGLDLPVTYAQQTPTGGLHYVFRTTVPISNSVGGAGKAADGKPRFPLGLDIRGTGGFIVGAGSVVAKGTYTIEDGSARLAAAPDALVARCAPWVPPRVEGSTDVPEGIDEARAAERAVAYLATAPVSVKGQGGDATAYQVAARLKDIGVSEAAALNLMMSEHWHHGCGWSPERLERKVANAFSYGRSAPGSAAPETAFQPGAVAVVSSDGHKRAKADVLVDLAADATLFHDGNGAAYAEIRHCGHKEVWPLKSQNFRYWLSQRYFDLTSKGVAAAIMDEAVGTLAAKALFAGRMQEVFNRVAGYKGRILIDLCNDTFSAVEVTADGWRVVAPEVAFVRHRHQRPLPMPERGGSLAELDSLINADADGLDLVKAWILAAFRPGAAYPVLIVQGEAGTGKSSMTRVVRGLIDPSAVPLRSMPKEEKDLMLGAAKNHVVALDNLSGAQAWQSDAICRIATGGGYAARTLYTDDEETAMDIRRPVILNGIDDLAARQDLASRAVIVTLNPLPAAVKKGDVELMERFGDAAPRIFGAVLDALVVALHNIELVRLTTSPRMLDFAQWAVAALGAEWEHVYARNNATQAEEAMGASPLARALRALLAKHNEWRGPSADLFVQLNAQASDSERRERSWPQSAKALGSALRRIGPHLRATGIDIRQGKGGREGRDYSLKLTEAGKDAFHTFQPFRPIHDGLAKGHAWSSSSFRAAVDLFQSVPANDAAANVGTGGTHGTNKSAT